MVAAYLATTLKIYDDPNRWPPEDDPAVALNEQLQRKFGGANLVTIMVSRNDGESIVQADTLATVKRITTSSRSTRRSTVLSWCGRSSPARPLRPRCRHRCFLLWRKI